MRLSGLEHDSIICQKEHRAGCPLWHVLQFMVKGGIPISLQRLGYPSAGFFLCIASTCLFAHYR